MLLRAKLRANGQVGSHTLTALHNFQSSNGLALRPGIDAGVVATLTAALPLRPICL
jgi:hypothetical protein